MEFIDQKLIKQAEGSSPAIAQIDISWKTYVRKVKENIFKLPFPGNYNARIINNYILIEGYNGPLLTDRVCDDSRTYILCNPIRCQDFRVFGFYNKSGQFQDFCSDPTIGAHYLSIIKDIGVRHMCVGDLEYKEPASFEMLQEVCKRIVESKRVIYLGSLGSVFLPDDMAVLKDILTNGNNTGFKIEQLLENELIEKIL